MDLKIPSASTLDLANLEDLLPPLRTFRVIHYTQERDDGQSPVAVQESFVISHTYTIEQGGALSFIKYVLYHGTPLPQKHKSIPDGTWGDVEEVENMHVGNVGNTVADKTKLN